MKNKARQNLKAMYEDGDWFAIPLPNGGFAIGKVARVNRKGKIALGYFFGPRLGTLPESLDTNVHTPESAILIAKFGDLGLQKGVWPVIAHSGKFERKWPLPKFQRVDAISGKVKLIQYSEDDLIKEIAKEDSDIRTSEYLPQDGLWGYGAIEKRLDSLL